MTYVTNREKELKTKWPHISGLTAGTTKQAGRTTALVPVDGSTVLRKERAGIK